MNKLDRWIDQQNAMETPKPVDLTGYLTETAANSLYLGKTATADNSARLGGQLPSYYAPAEHDHPQYLLTTDKASDSDKLDGVDSTGFVKTTGTQTVGGTKTFSSIPVLPASNPTTANQAVRKGYADGAYLGINGKAADSDKLDGLDSTAFLQTSAWTSWTPTLVGWSSTTTVYCYYYKLGKIMFFFAIITGTSNSTSTSFTLPETAILTEFSGVMGYCVNGGSALTVAGRYNIAQGSNICKAYTDMASGAWTASGIKHVSVYGWISTN